MKKLKECNKCGKILIWPECLVQCTRKNGRKYVYRYCKLCRQKYTRLWQQNNQERVRAYRKKYYLEHKERFREYKRRERLRKKTI